MGITHNASYAVRRALRQWGLSATLTATLSLGLGGATAMLGLGNRVLVNPLGLPEPQRVVQIYASGDPATAASYSRLAAFSSVAGYTTGTLAVSAGLMHGQQTIAAVTRGFFGVAGVAPQQGRAFTGSELRGGERVAVISHRLATGYGATALGRTLSLGGIRFTVVGVMPAGFAFPDGTAVWVAWQTNQKYLALQDGPLYGGLIGRRRGDVPLQQAGAQVAAEMRREASANQAAHPGVRYGMSDLYCVPLVQSWSSNSRATLDFLLTAAGLLWLAVCFNSGGVLAARALGDQKEMATRLALGARRWRLAAQWLWEAAALVAPAAIAAAGVTAGLMGLLRRGAPASMLGVKLLRPAWNDWAALTVLSLLTLVVVTIPPALSTLRTRPSAPMMQSAHIGRVRASVLWPALVVAELTVALALSAGAALLLASYGKLTRVNLGFRAKGVSAVSFTTAPVLLPMLREAGAARGGHKPALLRAAAARARQLAGSALAGVRRAVETPVALASQQPVAVPAGLYVRPVPAVPGRYAEGAINNVSGNYFATLRIPLQRGRTFTAGDGPGAPGVAMVSLGLAHDLWGERDPIGRQILIGNETRPRKIIGVTADIVAGGPGQEPIGTGQIYLPWRQAYLDQPAGQAVLLVRSSAVPVVAQLGSEYGIGIMATTTLTQAEASVLAPQRFNAFVPAVFSSLALLLIAFGVLGLLTHWVSGRRREIAIRLALGALPSALARTVLAQLALMLGAAAGFGLILSPLETALLGHLLYGVSPFDPSLWAAAAACVSGAAFAAAAVPAFRAAHVAPAEALRYE